jgi:hypothetical protein
VASTLDPLHALRQALTDLEIAALQREVSELRDSLSFSARPTNEIKAFLHKIDAAFAAIVKN